MTRASGPFDIITVLDNTRTILKDGIETTFSIVRTDWAPRLNRAHHADTDKDNTVKNKALTKAGRRRKQTEVITLLTGLFGTSYQRT